MCYTIAEIQSRVVDASYSYNQSAADGARIKRVTLFGSYANGSQNDDLDVDLLVSYSSPTMSSFTLVRVLEAMELRFYVPVDLVQDPLPVGALLEVNEKMLL